MLLDYGNGDSGGVFESVLVVFYDHGIQRVENHVWHSTQVVVTVSGWARFYIRSKISMVDKFFCATLDDDDKWDLEYISRQRRKTVKVKRSRHAHDKQHNEHRSLHSHNSMHHVNIV